MGSASVHYHAHGRSFVACGRLAREVVTSASPSSVVITCSSCRYALAINSDLTKPLPKLPRTNAA